MKRIPTLTTLALVSTLAMAGCGTAGEQTTGSAAESASPTAAAGAQTGTAAAGSTGSASPASEEPITEEHNDADTMFAQMMIPHHQQAVEMSEMMLAKDNLDPQIQELANKIVAAQGPEIDRLEQMLEVWGEPTMMESGGTESGGMDHESMGHGSDSGTGMKGMMTDEDMDQLEAAEGDEASELFLTQMTAHHRGAIDMAKEEVANGQNPQAIAMAQKVIDDQEAEIAEMDALLQQLQS
ncbi:DUF305 domain-containing protein [Kocuria sp. KRD140]|uniref:DUF305 domain-containing protein n=1 Tax=Kocuria sp. KRD140 TaxID=2729723 RepID=UPI0019D05415|nr:DUF305 domain-containing protein [Kocuria sp. KRD140]